VRWFVSLEGGAGSSQSTDVGTCCVLVRVCLVYDCLFPYTVGGAERWLRGLAERLAADGHEVSYLTLRQWDRGEEPSVPGVRVLAVGPRLSLYTVSGRRRVGPPLAFGAGVLWHLLRHGRRYDAVHTVSFPYFSLLAAAAARPLGRYRIVTDWFEVWTRAYWRGYLGGIGGWVGWAVQALCLRVPQRAFCFSQLHARRMRAEGFRGELTPLRGLYAGTVEPRPTQASCPTVVFAGRFIPEKQVAALVPALAQLRARLPEVGATLFGDGPEHGRVAAAVSAAGLDGAVRLPGFVAGEEVQDGLAHALCLALPSSREGFGLVVVEAASYGTPSVVVAGDDNAAVELIDVGVNGVVAPSASADDLAAAILAVHDAGQALRDSTAAWFAEHAPRLSLQDSLAAVTAAYAHSARS
jgi:glycosyltransferase involved in cell wall biosynthesis